jgi:hypothetical protein
MHPFAMKHIKEALAVVMADRAVDMRKQNEYLKQRVPAGMTHETAMEMISIAPKRFYPTQNAWARLITYEQMQEFPKEIVAMLTVVEQDHRCMEYYVIPLWDKPKTSFKELFEGKFEWLQKNFEMQVTHLDNSGTTMWLGD